MTTTFHKSFTLQDGTDVQVRMCAEDCYEFRLLTPDFEIETFKWSASEPKDIVDSTDLSELDRRRNEALQLLWKEL